MNMNMRINCCKALESRSNNSGDTIVFKNRSSVSSGTGQVLSQVFWSWTHGLGHAFSFCFDFQLPYPSACFGIIK